MSRKRKPVEAANHERWLISYADFITLLFAFFVVMFASSEANKSKAKLVSEAVQNAFSNGAGQSSVRGSVKGATKKEQTGNAKEAADLALSLRILQTELQSEIRSGKIKMSLQQRGLIVTLSEAGFFQPGDDRLEQSTFPAFEKLSKALKTLPNPVRLEGHTDSVPIHNPRFRSNWDLSAARALAVLTVLENTNAINRTRLSAAGYADTAPVESNETDTGRARNRRVDLVVLSVSGMAGQPASAPAAPGA